MRSSRANEVKAKHPLFVAGNPNSWPLTQMVGAVARDGEQSNGDRPEANPGDTRHRYRIHEMPMSAKLGQRSRLRCG